MIKQNINTVFLIALALFGDFALTLNFTGNALNDVIALTLSFILSFAIVFAVRCVLIKLPNKNFKFKKEITAIAVFLAALIFFAAALFTAYNFSRYASTYMLQTKDIFIAFISFSALSFLFSQGSLKILSKTALILLPVSVAIILAVALFSVPFVNTDYLIPYKMPTMDFTQNLCRMLWGICVPALATVMLMRKKSAKSTFFAFEVGFVLCLAITFNVIALFGSEFAAGISYPYSEAVSTATLSGIFSRLDGLFYFLCFSSSLIKTVLCVRSGIYLLRTWVLKFLS